MNACSETYIWEGYVPDQELLEERAEVDLSEKVFTNSPNMLVLCLTVIGLIKIYTRFEKITTLADNFLAFFEATLQHALLNHIRIFDRQIRHAVR